MSNNVKMPAIFSGHGSPMLALDDNEVTRGLRRVGDAIMKNVGRPKAILAISAHWVAKGTYIQRTDTPRQVYDMYGFPEELYNFRYDVNGDTALSDRVLSLLGDRVSVNNDWGIDHGTWTVLCHVFPEADIPVVQLSLDATLSRQEMYAIGQSLAPLRDEGYLIFASGNVVHNLSRVEWTNPHGTAECVSFNDTVKEYVARREDARVMDYEAIPHASYAVPTPEHYVPLIYILGAAQGETPVIFNDHCELGAIAMTGFAFGVKM